MGDGFFNSPLPSSDRVWHMKPICLHYLKAGRIEIEFGQICWTCQQTYVERHCVPLYMTKMEISGLLIK